VGPRRVHLCLICTNAESIQNHNVFIEAAAERLKRTPTLMSVLQIRRNVDSLQLAHELATSSVQNMKVCILNGANRKLFGNHWFESGARTAIDENLHRRSASMARAALLLNFDTKPRLRNDNELCNTLEFFKQLVADDKEVGAPPSKTKGEVKVKKAEVQTAKPAGTVASGSDDKSRSDAVVINTDGKQAGTDQQASSAKASDQKPTPNYAKSDQDKKKKSGLCGCCGKRKQRASSVTPVSATVAPDLAAQGKIAQTGRGAPGATKNTPSAKPGRS